MGVGRKSIRISTFTFAQRAAGKWRRFMRAVRPSPKRCSHSTPNMLTKRPKLRSVRHFCSMTATCWWQIRGGGSQRSSAGPEPERDTRNHIVRLYMRQCMVGVLYFGFISQWFHWTVSELKWHFDGHYVLCGYDNVMSVL